MSKRPVVANLDFADVKQDLIDHFKSRPEFKDYEFTGSGLNLLLDILAYNTHYNALTANFMMNEQFLDTAVMRNNVVSLAKSLNYLPRSQSAASATITLNIPRRNNELFYVVPAGSKFTVASDLATLSFYTIDAFTVQFRAGETEKNVTVTAYEGELTSQRFIKRDSNPSFTAFDLVNTLIDTSTISVSVNGVRYVQVTPEIEGISDVKDTSRVFFVEETRELSYRIIFGDGVIGKALEQGDEVIATYLRTNGSGGNGVTGFTADIETRPEITVVESSISAGGNETESIREVKVNAPRWFQSQYRAVTENDYDVFLRKRYADIQALSVYGGEKVGAPGKVFICIKPKSADKLSEPVKQKIIGDILNDSNVVTITPVITDPFLIDIIPKSLVIYDKNLSVNQPDVIKAGIITLFNNFNTEYIGDFMKTFSISQLSNEIKGVDDSIVSSNTRIGLRTKVTAKNKTLSLYNFTFGNKLFNPTKGFNKEFGGILSTNEFFRVGQVNKSGFDDDGEGNLRLFDIIDGTKTYINKKAGTIDYVTGTINVTLLFDPADGDIYFTVVPDSFDVLSTNNTILRIATDDAVVLVVEKNDSATIANNNLSRSV